MINAKLVIIRGLPGSGKSTMALKAFADRGYVHCEADHFFHRNGKYAFDQSKLVEAHEYCRDRTHAALMQNKKVVVANTFSRKWEIMELLSYLPIDKKDIKVIVAHGGKGSTHNVPDFVTERMRNRWEDFEHEVHMQLDPDMLVTEGAAKLQRWHKPTQLA